MFYVYVLWSHKLGKHYVGCTKDVESRLKEHNQGRNRFTKGGIPWSRIHIEEFFDLSAARKRETFLKSGVGRSWLKQQNFQYTKEP